MISVGGTVIIGSGGGASLPAGTAGYILRYAGGAWVARELAAAGLAAARPAAAAGREGQLYWSTDAAAGAELTLCVHKGGSTYAWETIPYGTRSQIVGGGIVAITAGSPAGSTIIADGAGDITLTSANVSALLAASDFATVRTLLGAASAAQPSVYDCTSSTGWTAAAGTGTAAITGGVARLSHGAGTAYRTAAVAYDGPLLYRALTEPTDGPVDVAVRIASMGIVPTTDAILELATAATAGTRYGLIATDAGDVLLYREDTNAVLETISTAFAAYTGQEWLRLRAAYGRITPYYGVGVGGARPTAWTALTPVTAPSGSLWTHVGVGLVVVGTGSTSTVDFDDLTTLEPPVATL